MEKKAYFLLAAFAAALILLNYASPVLYWDENTYLANARGHIGESKYTEDFRFPLLSLVISAVWIISGESLFAAKLVFILFSVVCGLLMHKTAEAMLGRKAAITATLLFCTNCLVLTWGFRVYTDIPGLMLVLLGFYLFSTKEGLLWRGVSGALFGAAFLMRFTYGIFISVILATRIIAFAKNRKIKELNKNLCVVLGFTLALTPWLLYNQAKHGNMLWNIIQQYNIVGSSQAWQPVYLQILNTLAVFGPMLILILSSFYLITIRNEKKMQVPALFFAAHLLYILFFVKTKDARYIIPVLPFGILCTLYATWQAKKVLRKWIVPVLVIFNVVACGIGVWHNVNEGNCMRNGALMQSIEYIRDHSYPDDAVISNVWPWYGYYNNLESHSMWSSRLAGEIEQYDADYLIYHDSIGDRVEMNSTGIAMRLERRIEGCDGSVHIYS
jgi:4-amino-4-deoxy-L-arabinose transferase-like glycosyltransferase